jgi:hypothetical protein
LWNKKGGVMKNDPPFFVCLECVWSVSGENHSLISIILPEAQKEAFVFSEISD